MSTFQVKVCKVDEVNAHPNAHSLDIIKLKDMDWQVVSAKGNFKKDDLCTYFPIDSLLPTEIESKIFGLDSKVKLHNSRVKTIKLRGAISQGLIVTPELLGIEAYEGNDVTEELKITKYEPISASVGNNLSGKSNKRKGHPDFRKYTGIENAKNYSKVFEENEEITVTEKIHGTNFRCGYLPFYADTLFKKLKKWLGMVPKYEFVYGSHNVQLQNQFLSHKGYYAETVGNVYSEAVNKYNLKDVLKPGEVIFGEIYGDGIQKGYIYGCSKGERKFIGFEVMINGEYLDSLAAKKWFEARQLPFVPVLYTGPFNKEKILQLRDGPSVLAPSQLVREGVVVRSLKEEKSYIGRKILKFISDNYLLKNQDSETVVH